MNANLKLSKFWQKFYHDPVGDDYWLQVTGKILNNLAPKSSHYVQIDGQNDHLVLNYFVLTPMELRLSLKTTEQIWKKELNKITQNFFNSGI